MFRNQSIDTLRTLAVIMVVIMHVCSYFSFKISGYDTNFWTLNIFNSFSRVCIPVFIMISGSFLLGREESISHFYKKRASKIIIPLCFWSVFYILYRILLNYSADRGYFAEGLAYDILAGKPYFHLWYLYMLIGIYLVTPLLNKIIAKVSMRNIWILAIVLLIFGFIMDIRWSFIENPYFFTWFLNYLGFFILGFLLKDIRIVKSFYVFWIYFLGSLGIAIATYFTLLNYESIYFYKYVSPLVIISSIGLFLFFSNITLSENTLSKISKYTFGIYLIHAFILDLVYHLSKLGLLPNFELVIFNITFNFIITFGLSVLGTYIIYQVPLLKRII